MQAGQQKRRLELPADTETLAEISELVAQAGRSAGFNDAQIGDLLLVMDEACTNAIVHGLKRDPARRFSVEVNWRAGEIELIVRDDGTPFQPANLKKPDLDAPLEDRPIGGLGVYFIHSLMDEVEYLTEEGGMKVLRMVKRTSPAG